MKIVRENIFKPKTTDEILKDFPTFKKSNIQSSESTDIVLDTLLYKFGSPKVYKAIIMEDPTYGKGIMIFYPDEHKWKMDDAEYFDNLKKHGKNIRFGNRFGMIFKNWTKLIDEIEEKYPELIK